MASASRFSDFVTSACDFIWSVSPAPQRVSGIMLPDLEKSGRRASPSAYNDDSVKKRHNDVPVRNEVYHNKPPLGIETPLLHCVKWYK